MYVEVLVDVNNRRLDRSYYYKIPGQLILSSGMLVLVPLQNRKVQGLVVRVLANLPDELEEYKIKEVEKILQEQCLLPQDLLELASWMAETTICSMARSLHTVWPFLKGKLEEWLIPLAGIKDEDVQALEILDPDAYRVLEVLNRAKRNGLPENVLLKRANISKKFAEELVKQGWVKKEKRFSSKNNLKKVIEGDSYNEKIESFNSRGDGCFERIMNQGARQHSEEVKLSFAQLKALEYIWDKYVNKSKNTVLLHGITGSGKTQVYVEFTSRVLSEGGDVILLVPEISLTSQIAAVFIEQFGDAVSIIHSGLKTGEKLKIWEEILKGEKRIVIGARSAVFAPLPRLSAIIIDEEHDGAYKQDENPKYHARDVARKRMEQLKGLVVLGSATPSLEAYAAGQRDVIGLTSITERFNQKDMPVVKIIDMKAELAGGNKSIFSLELMTKLRNRIELGEQSILFLNRRGYSTFVFCRECGYVARCPNCDVSLTYHSNKEEMCCHYCNYRVEVFHNCPECGSRYIRFFGQGTQRVEEEVKIFFPEVPVLRLDTDTTKGEGKHEEIIEKFRHQEASILVGTQMLAKGLDFHNVTLVGVISADQLLNMPDFRSRERTFQLLTQVAGRAGRGDKPGEVVIQTYSPEDRAIYMAAKHDFTSFFWDEISYRKKMGYPPFSHIIRILVYHEKEERVIKAAGELADSLKKALFELGKEDYMILGPAPSVLTRLKNEYRWQVSLKGKNPDILRKIVYKGVQYFYKCPSSSGVNISPEVNPM
ncbi:MAG: primosomal protein N' [Eubacteriales bacterium]